MQTREKVVHCASKSISISMVLVFYALLLFSSRLINSNLISFQSNKSIIKLLKVAFDHWIHWFLQTDQLQTVDQILMAQKQVIPFSREHIEFGVWNVWKCMFHLMTDMGQKVLNKWWNFEPMAKSTNVNLILIMFVLWMSINVVVRISIFSHISCQNCPWRTERQLEIRLYC